MTYRSSCLGETGTGKELFAEAIHECQPSQGHALCSSQLRCDSQRSLRTQSCLAIAREHSLVRLLLAKDISARLTVARSFLMRWETYRWTPKLDCYESIQQKEVTPVGESRPVKVDVRIVAATHRDLMADVAEGQIQGGSLPSSRGRNPQSPAIDGSAKRDIDLLTDCLPGRLQCRHSRSH
jgi:transcriptional regulator of acetoin/glycerol metabolism